MPIKYVPIIFYQKHILMLWETNHATKAMPEPLDRDVIPFYNDKYTLYRNAGIIVSTDRTNNMCFDIFLYTYKTSEGLSQEVKEDISWH